VPDDLTDHTDSWLRRFARREPLITRAVISALVLAAASVISRFAGIELDQDTTIAVLLGWLGLTGAVIREGVTSPAGVDKATAHAAEEALLQAPVGQATVLQVGPDLTAVHVDRIADPPAAVDPFADRPAPKPAAGLAAPAPADERVVPRYDPPTPVASPCPTCGDPVVYASMLNARNGRWTVLPLEAAFAADVEADFELSGDVHEAVDIMGNVAGVFPVAVYVNSSTGNNWRTHPPSHFLGHDH
jgi:hypothetical protein